MRKMILLLCCLWCFSLTTYADEGYVEDFSRYNHTAIYNSEDLTISYDGYPDASLTSNREYIINGAGGIYAENEVYNANAAENLYCYAKTGDGAAKLVFGGLNNGWRGFYSHPPTSMNGQGGAGGELNKYNRRLAVVDFQGNNVLQMSNTKSEYVPTYSVYAKDDVEFYENTKWSTDVYIENYGVNGYFSMSLTKGQINKVIPFQAVSSVANGRDSVNDVLKFIDGKVYCFDEEAMAYDKAKWYTVETMLKSSEDNLLCTVSIKDKGTGAVLYSKDNISLNAKLNEDITGLGYCTYTPKNSEASSVYIDNISIEKIDFYATIATTREISINGRGNVAIKFNSEYIGDSINDSTIKVYCGDTQIEGCGVSTLTQNRVKIDLPTLKPATEYTIRVNGVMGRDGIEAKCEVPFKTVPYAKLSNASISGENLSFKLKNNSAGTVTAYVSAVCENDNDMIVDFHYKKVELEPEQESQIKFTEIASENSSNIYLYVTDDLSTNITPFSDSLKISK